MENQEKDFDVETYIRKLQKDVEDLDKYDDLVFRPIKYPEQGPNHVCPNCGYCPLCGRKSWPVTWPPYKWYEPIWVVTSDSYTYC